MLNKTIYFIGFLSSRRAKLKVLTVAKGYLNQLVKVKDVYNSQVRGLGTCPMHQGAIWHQNLVISCLTVKVKVSYLSIMVLGSAAT
jgi:hypothetical protein